MNKEEFEKVVEYHTSELVHCFRRQDLTRAVLHAKFLHQLAFIASVEYERTFADGKMWNFGN